LNLLPLLGNEQVDVGALAVYSSPLSDEERCRLKVPSIDVGRRSRKDYTFVLRLVREIRRFKPDIVHTHTHVGKYWGGLAAKAAGVRRIVHTEHNPCDPRRNVLERVVDRVLHAVTDRVVTFLSEQRQVLSRVDGVALEKIAIIPNGLAASEFVTNTDCSAVRLSLGVREDEFAVLLIGRLEHQKNQQLALRSLKEVNASLRRRIRLFLLGTGSCEAALRSLTAELHLEENVAFLGYRKDVSSLLSCSDLLLMTSLFEGMPLALIEGMLARVPILSTPWIGARGMLGNGRYGFISPDFEPRTLAVEMERALCYEGGRAAVARRAHERARSEFDIRRMADAYRALYLDITKVPRVT
jgi:glycosyltransferase involved in cell wall biosynthesis